MGFKPGVRSIPGRGRRCVRGLLIDPSDAGYKGINYISAETMAYYKGKIGPKMMAALEEMKATRPDAFDVSEELDQIRLVHTQEMSLYSAILEIEDKCTPDEFKSAIQSAGQLMRSSAEHVMQCVEKAARIHAATADKLSPIALDMLSKQVTTFIYRAFDMPDIVPGDSEELQQKKREAKERIREFDKFMNEELRLPTLKELGTSITPDQQVLAMDSTIPREPEKEIED